MSETATGIVYLTMMMANHGNLPPEFRKLFELVSGMPINTLSGEAKLAELIVTKLLEGAPDGICADDRERVATEILQSVINTQKLNGAISTSVLDSAPTFTSPTGGRGRRKP